MNKWPITLVIIIAGLVFGWVDAAIEKETSTWVQWAIFLICIILILLIHFYTIVDEVEYEEEYYPFEPPSLQDKQVAELTEELKAQEITLGIGYPASKEDIEWANQKPEHSKEKIFYVVQPIHVTQEEFNEKINTNNIDMKEEVKKELPKALADPEIVIGYSLHSIFKKHRPMYDDICGFAINGGTKTEAEITGRLRSYGFPFTVEKPKGNCIAFNIESSPAIRLPEKGFFGIK